MASENVSQLIEKVVWTRVLLGTWNKDDIDLREDGDEETFFVNSFTEVKNHGHANSDLTLNIPYRNADFFTSECAISKNRSENAAFVASEKKLSEKTQEKDEKDPSRLEFSSSSNPNKEGADCKGQTSGDNVNDKNIDEVDYFDSDEEYMEIHGQRYDEEDISDVFEEYSCKSLKGRYSEGVEQYRNIPVYRRSIRRFARANHFEIYDVIPDGNCMFRAIADQFMINGRIGFTAEGLRCTAIDYLRNHPYKEDDNHIQSFLCTESWEDYLSRMSRSSEWSDHIVLQAVADAYSLDVIVFNVFQEDIRRTEVHPEIKRKEKRMQIFLGHLGEFHYLSLRPDHWTSFWPYKSLLYRLLACSNKLPLAAKQELIQKKIAEMGASKIVNQEEYLDVVQLPLAAEGREKQTNPDSSKRKFAHAAQSHEDNYVLHFDTYCLDDLQLLESEDSLSMIFFDPMYIDAITGIPLPHLSYILKQLFPRNMIKSYFAAQSPVVFSDMFLLHYIGSYSDGIYVFLKDISKNQRKRAFYNRHRQKIDGEFVLTPLDKMVRHSDINENQTSVGIIFADSSKTHPGYCHLKLPPNTKGINVKNVFQKGSEKFLTEVEVKAVVPLPEEVNVKYKGIVCETFPPFAQEWRIRERKFTFPSRQLIQKVLQSQCTLIKKAHPRSKEPDIEWKYNFSMAEHTIFTTGLTDSQIHGFCVFKVLVENVTIHLTKQLKHKHLKAVYLRTLEDIPCEAWETNFGGCLLFVISALVAYLKAKFLPHYFIPSNNLIECYLAEEIEAISVNVECIRMFPVAVIQNIAENHGYQYAPKLIRKVFANCKSLMHNKDLMTILMDAFTPETLYSIKVMTRLGWYETAFQLLQYVHEQMLVMPMPTECFEMPSFLEFYHTALKSLRQKSSRIILAKNFDIKFKTDILKEYIDDNATYAKDILPWKVDYRIGWTEIPKEKSTDFSSLADFFYAYSTREFDKRNSTLSVLAIETAILCIKKAIKMDSISTEEIEDESLKEEIISQKDQMIRNLKRRLETYYIHVYAISLQYLTFKPLQDHMDDIEKLCDELPEMTLSVSRMFRYLKREEKALEYERRSNTSFKGREDAYLYHDF